MEARAEKIPLVNEVMGQGGDVHSGEKLAGSSVQNVMRQGSGKNGSGGGVPSVQNVMGQGGKSK
jgi:hypothetical protein